MSQRLLSVLAAATLVAACSCKHSGTSSGGGGTIVGIDGLGQATPNPLDFGTVGTGTTHSKSFVLSNAGDGPLNILSSAVTGDTSFTAASQQGVTLQPAGTITVNVTFTPQIDGPHTASLTFTTDSTSSPKYVVTLTGVAFSYKVEVSPIELDFGEVQVGTSSPSQTVTVTNNSSAAETITVGAVTGATDFQVTPTGAQSNVPSNGSFTVTVIYAPTTTGAEQAQLPISACSGCTPVDVALTGTGIDTQVVVYDYLTFQPFVSFGQVPQGTTVTADVMAQANALPATATTLLAATLTAPPTLTQGTPGFTVTPTDANFNPSPGGVPATWPASITPGTAASSIAYFIVSYTPPAGSSSANDIVDVAYNVGTIVKTPAQLPVSAGLSSGQCSQVVATPTSVNFGTVLSGATSSKAVTLTNNGPQACQLLTISINPNDAFNEFGLQGTPATPLSLGPGQTQLLTATFTPATGTPPLLRKADLSITTTDTLTPTITVPLSGTLQNVSYAASAWPKWHHDNGNTGLSGADTSANNGTLIWKLAIGKPSGPSGEYASYIHSPSIGKDPNSGDDIIYMLGYNNWVAPASWGKPGSGTGIFYAVDGPSGNQIFATQMTGPEASAQESTPTIVADGSIYLMTGGEQGTYPQFYHVAANGSILWSGVQAIGGDLFACPFTATPSATANCSTVSTNPEVNDGFDTCPGFDDNGLLYLFDDDQPGCDTYNSAAAAAGAPTPVWSATATAPVSSSGKPAAHIESFSAALTDTGQSVFSWGGYVLAYNPSATAAPTETWNVSTGNGQMQVGWATVSSGGCETTSKGSPAIDGVDAVVAFGGFTSSCAQAMGGIVAINLATGNQDWGFSFPNAALPAAPFTYTAYNESEIVLADSSPATIGDNGVVMGWLDGVYTFDPPASGLGNATQRWYVPTGLVLSSPAVGADGTIFVGSTDGNLYAINNTTGAVKFKYSVGAAINSSPAIGSDGTVYFAADDGNLYAVR
jgi:outer membrane protein assembly factor BamB